MFLACAGSIAEGTRIKIFIEWPSLLNGTTPLQLITVGTVVRSTSNGVSIVFESYQFKTMARGRNAIVQQMPSLVRSAYSEAQPQPMSLMAKASN